VYDEGRRGVVGLDVVLRGAATKRGVGCVVRVVGASSLRDDCVFTKGDRAGTAEPARRFGSRGAWLRGGRVGLSTTGVLQL